MLRLCCMGGCELTQKLDRRGLLSCTRTFFKKSKENFGM
jgi:hypothetical protein